MIHWTALLIAYLVVGLYLGICTAIIGAREARSEQYHPAAVAFACVYYALLETALWFPWLLWGHAKVAFPHPDDEESE